MRMGAANKYVALAQGPQTTNGPFAALSPANVWAAIEPYTPAGENDRTITHLVRCRYHSGISHDTRVAYTDNRLGTTRYLYVRGFRDVNEQGDEMQLLCEEVRP